MVHKKIHPLHLESRESHPNTVTIVTVPGVESSFLEFPILAKICRNEPQYYPLCTVCEMMSRTEGPLYHKVRGTGLAYDASVFLALWWKQLNFTLYETSAPIQATDMFFSLLQDMSEVLTEFNLQTSKCALLFRYHNSRSTGPHLIAEEFKSFLLKMGPTLEDPLFGVSAENQLLSSLISVNLDQINTVIDSMLKVFLNSKSLFIATNPETAKTIVQDLKKSPHLAKSSVTVCGVDDLMMKK